MAFCFYKSVAAAIDEFLQSFCSLTPPLSYINFEIWVSHPHPKIQQPMDRTKSCSKFFSPDNVSFEYTSHMCYIATSNPTKILLFFPGGSEAASEPAEGQLSLRLSWRWGVSSHEPCGEGSQAERSHQRRGLHRGGRRLLRQEGLYFSEWHNVWFRWISLNPVNHVFCLLWRSSLKTTKPWLLLPKPSKRTCSSHIWMTMKEGDYLFLI